MIKVDVPSIALLVDKRIQVWLSQRESFFCWQIAIHWLWRMAPIHSKSPCITASTQCVTYH